MKYSQVVLIAIGGVALGVSAKPIATPRQGLSLKKAGETPETMAEGIDGGVGAVGSTAGTPHAVHQSHKAFRKNPSTQHSFVDSRISESTTQDLRTDTTLQPAKSEHQKGNRESSTATRVPTAARAFDDELFARDPSKALKTFRSGAKAATRAAGGTEGVGSSLGGIYGAYQRQKAAKTENEARDLEDEMLEARGLVEAWKALWKPQSKEDKARKLQEAARLASEKAAAATAALDERDFFEMEDDLTARNFDYEVDELD